MTGGPTTVLVADDHPDVRQGLLELLAGVEDLEAVGAASDGAEAVSLAELLHPDVVLMDLAMPLVDGVEATRRILADRPETRIVILTSFADQEQVLAALDAGATGYLLKDAEPSELLDGIRAAVRGEAPFSPGAARALVSISAAQATGERMTRRQREVLALLGGGLTNRAIARRLGISEKTVKGHLSQVFAQIGVTDRAHAAQWAKDHGLRS